MTDFDGIWAKASARMDQGTDRIVGDRVSYNREGKGFEMIDAYIVISRTDLDAPSEFDETVAITKRIKVRCSLFPEPDIADRVRHPLLGPGTYRPTTSLPAEQGRYWIADLQKV